MTIKRFARCARSRPAFVAAVTLWVLVPALAAPTPSAAASSRAQRQWLDPKAGWHGRRIMQHSPAHIQDHRAVASKQFCESGFVLVVHEAFKEQPIFKMAGILPGIQLAQVPQHMSQSIGSHTRQPREEETSPNVHTATSEAEPSIISRCTRPGDYFFWGAFSLACASRASPTARRA